MISNMYMYYHYVYIVINSNITILKNNTPIGSKNAIAFKATYSKHIFLFLVSFIYVYLFHSVTYPVRQETNGASELWDDPTNELRVD